MNFSKVSFRIVVGALLLSCSSYATRVGSRAITNQDSSLTYANPVFEPILADPTVFRDPSTGVFYAYGTQDNWGDGQGSRLVPILQSSDLIHWRSVGNALREKPNWKSKGGIWAPDVVQVYHQYHLYYAYSTWGDPNPGIGVAVAKTPEGPFTDQGKLFDSKSIDVPNSIDPFYYEDQGKKYVFWGSFSDAPTQGTFGVELTDDGLDIAADAEKFKLAAGDFEAVIIHKRNDYYYFIGSKGSCCEGKKSTYRVLVGRSSTLKGPYLDKQGRDIAERGNGTLLLKGNSRFVGTGHNSRIITDDNEQDWMLYHGIDTQNDRVASGTSRRVLMLDAISWKDEWPSVAGDTASFAPQAAPYFKK
ncbi:family 43 glycosylhydrolase [Sphingobacterium sp. lm-10]|uniref:family 43 glycosylhydrolase n=1 Tax=Sphingobacterium sp. lm-10 TaxID=2944904 RepID=UPI002020E9EE|nr:family 43 glycosylhydrolase [Sphingobacterium sp. lm-10]